MTRVAVFGANGKMGAEVCRAVAEAGMISSAAIDVGDDRSAAENAEVVVDFTHPDAVMDNLQWCIEHGIHAVVGTTGFTAGAWTSCAPSSPSTRGGGCWWRPTSIGCGVRCAGLDAARYYPSVEVIELHHPNKADAPSGTAATTVGKIAAARREGRSGRHPRCHPARPRRRARCAGRGHPRARRALVRQCWKVLFGAPGETLTIRHDSMDRASFMPGVVQGHRGGRFEARPDARHRGPAGSRMRRLLTGLLVTLLVLGGLAAVGDELLRSEAERRVATTLAERLGTTPEVQAHGWPFCAMLVTHRLPGAQVRADQISGHVDGQQVSVLTCWSRPTRSPTPPI